MTANILRFSLLALTQIVVAGVCFAGLNVGISIADVALLTTASSVALLNSPVGR